MGHRKNLEFAYLVDHRENVPLVIDWWSSIWSDRMGSDRVYAQRQLQDSLSKTDLPIHIVAIVQGEPVGTAALKAQEIDEVFPDCQYWLGSVFVEEKYRGHGIASGLSLQIVEIAKQLRLPHLYLQTVALDGGLYSNLGWERVREFTHMNEHALLMLKKL